MTAEAMKRERKMTPARVEKIARKIDSEVDGLTAIETDERGEKSEPKSAKDFFDTDQKQEILLRVIKLEEKPELDEITAERFIRQKFFEKMIHARTNQKADIELFDGDGGGITPSNYQTVAGEIF
jgi:chorismate mutase